MRTWQSDSAEVLRGDPFTDVVIAIDDHGRPVGLVFHRRSNEPWALRQSVLRVRSGSSVTEVVQRAMTRAADDRFNPVVVSDSSGHPVGIIRIERLVEHLLKC